MVQHSLPLPVYEDVHSGQLNNGTWSSTVFIGGVNHGEGSGNTKGAAKEEAARRALRGWNFDRFQRTR